MIETLRFLGASFLKYVFRENAFNSIVQKCVWELGKRNIKKGEKWVLKQNN